MIKRILFLLFLFPAYLSAQINTDRVMANARNALYFEDYVLSIQYFNQVINAKPYLYEPYFYRALAKVSLDDYRGAEMDCDAAIERNPFVIGAYQVRGLARIRQNKYDEAIEDYQTALRHAPENITLWHNLTLCHIQKKDYEAAEKDLDELLTIAPRYTRGYLMRGEVAMYQNDTIRALNDFDKAIAMDKYDPDTWASRAIVYLQQEKYAEAESDLNQATHLNNKNSANYINRALARYHQKNLRGAMSDYDIALEIEPSNFYGHYNRGLLRAQVGDDNRAIEDFDFVLQVDPDDMMATFNRGVLRAQTGDYLGAISDYTAVINQHPNFATGYYFRAEARRKTGDRRGADMDDLALMNIQMDQRIGKSTTTAISNPNTDLADNASDANEDDDAQGKTRKKSNKNMENYRKLVIADAAEADQKYSSDYRGKVQNRNVTIKLEPMYVLTYYEKSSEVKSIVHYHKFIDDLNRERLLPERLRITNDEAPLTEEQIKKHFDLIDTHTTDIVNNQQSAVNRFARAIDFYLVQDFASAMEDFTQSILLDDKFLPSYFMRALVRYKQLEYQRSEEAIATPVVVGALARPIEVNAVDYDLVKNDLNQAIALAPDFVYAYYNRANLLTMLKDYRAAIVDYNKAVELNPDFAEAYFNRGLTHIYLGNNRQGISDLSKAGELGIVSAYNIIKRFTETTE